MSIPYARRLPIPDIFRDPSLSMMEENDVEKSNIIENEENSLVGCIQVSSTAPSSPLLPSTPIILSSRRNDILPAPSEKRVKYVPFTRGSTINNKKKGFVRPKSPAPQPLPTNLDDQNVFSFPDTPDSSIVNSPVQTLVSTSDDSTLVAYNTPPSSRSSYKVEEVKVLKERTNTPSPVVPDGGGMPGVLPLSFLKDTTPVGEKEEHVLTAISNSTDGNMNMNASTAHLETAASLRSIRSTLNQLKKKKSRQSRPTHAKDIFIHKNETFTTEVSHAPPTKATETISDMITQLVNVVRHRIRPNHNEFMTKWSEVEMKTYDSRWEKLLHIKKSKATTRFSQIPWPVLPSLIIRSPSPNIITRTNVTRFLLCPDHEGSSSLEKIFSEIERWNDYKVMDSIMRNVREEDKKDVEMAWSRVVLVLMEMRGECMTGRSLF